MSGNSDFNDGQFFRLALLGCAPRLIGWIVGIALVLLLARCWFA